MVTPDPTDMLAEHLAEQGPWCCGAGRHPHVVPAEDLHAVDGAVLCGTCADRHEHRDRRAPEQGR